MLQIQHVCKEYRTGTLVQKALDDVSLNLRDNEFVAILGPSGSGKTTLLNIIGGLDRYDSGDLIINGISTKKYKDRDWDSYRNHTIGFVFQSYNLIPHQTLLANVELALTISGIDREQRRRRAKEALTQVGLGEQIGKKPNQLSGGQMQRVAIARALVNNPDILLADEPTGALDSDTSVQVMDLLREVAKDRLVVMVTHNPELAAEYATRIVKLRDGKIQSDSDAFFPDKEELSEPSDAGMGRSSMSFLTSLSLSFNNLLTKKARTLLTAFAGSIGIIGIALILALSNGVNDYIASVEEDTLSEYPVQITDTGFDFTSLLSAASGMVEAADEEDTADIRVVQLMTTLFAQIDSNDLGALKEYLESGTSGIEDYVQAIEYVYSVEPLAYREEDGSWVQVNPDTTLSSMGFSGSSYDLMSSYMSLDMFYSLPENENLYEGQYDVVAGHWPEDETECVLVLTSGGGITDLLLYTLGLRDSVELDEMIRQYRDGETIDVPEITDSYAYEDILGITFSRVDSADCYVYDSEYGVWTDKFDNEAYMAQLAAKGEELTIVGIVQPKEDASAAFLSSGIYYPFSLLAHIVEQAEESEIVQSQMETPEVNVLTGERFGDESDVDFDIASLFSIDADALAERFSFDADALDFSDINLFADDLSEMITIDADTLDLSALTEFDLSGYDVADLIDFEQLDLSELSVKLPEFDVDSLLASLSASISAEGTSEIAESLLAGYQEYFQEYYSGTVSDFAYSFEEYMNSEEARNILTDYFQQATEAEEKGEGEEEEENGQEVSDIDISGLTSALLDGYTVYAEEHGYAGFPDMQSSLTDYLATEEAQKTVTDGILAMIDEDAVQNALNEQIESYIQEVADVYADALADVLEDQISAMAEDAVEQVGSQIQEQIASAMTSVTEQIESQVMSAMETATESMMSQISEQIADAMEEAVTLDEEALSELFVINMDSEDLIELLTSMSASRTSSYENNLASLGYVDFDAPSEIDIYPIDFDSKTEVTNILDAYNARMEASGQDEKVITYTDMVGTLMSSVTSIINLISYVLIAFVAISLIVSSIMIGVITYISVLERRKEIGILRAIGASKNNISSVFNAETFIIGLCAGVMGIVLSLLLLIPGNALIHHLAGNNRVNAVLPAGPAFLLIVLSVLLTMIGGLIPSRTAAKSDPVTALRSE